MAILYILGAGNPTPTKNRFGSSYILNVKKDYFMIDCGPASTYKLVQAGLFPTQVNHLFFTHHHSDHNADYPCFLLCRWDQSTGKEEKLNVYGPPPTEWLTKRLIGEDGAFSHDLNARINHPNSQRVYLDRGGTLPRPGISLQVKDVLPGKICEVTH
jgi:ribonuclease BN (tRNA processing enzyme)